MFLFLAPGVARQSHWPNLGRGSKMVRNTGLRRSLKKTVLWNVTLCSVIGGSLLPPPLYPEGGASRF
jgi:hypothetical protein